MKLNRTESKSTLIKKTLDFLSRFGFDGFIMALLGMILLAWIFPEGGTGKGNLSLSSLANYGVSAIFFFYGLKLNRKKLAEGLSNWKLHIIVQTSSFILFPVLLLCFRPLFQQEDTHLLWLGCFFMAALPSTVSSSVVMVSIAEGNIPAAIFNASISSLLGVFITPLWLSLVQESGTHEADLSSTLAKLILQVLVPVVLGLLLNKKFGQYAEKHRVRLKHFDQLIILTIVYTSFCDSFEQNMFSSIDSMDLIFLSAGILAIFLSVYFLISMISTFLKFNREDRITAAFCGSKKSLVHGTVMAKVIFGESTIVGVLLLPLMLYHAFQLIIVSMIAQRMARHKKQIKEPGGTVTI